jgi:hypothetical protein
VVVKVYEERGFRIVTCDSITIETWPILPTVIDVTWLRCLQHLTNPVKNRLSQSPLELDFGVCKSLILCGRCRRENACYRKSRLSTVEPVKASTSRRLACDLMEPVRREVDAYLLDWLTHEPLRREWFFEQRDGNCRLMGYGPLGDWELGPKACQLNRSMQHHLIG